MVLRLVGCVLWSELKTYMNFFKISLVVGAIVVVPDGSIHWDSRAKTMCRADKY